MPSTLHAGPGRPFGESEGNSGWGGAGAALGTTGDADSSRVEAQGEEGRRRPEPAVVCPRAETTAQLEDTRLPRTGGAGRLHGALSLAPHQPCPDSRGLPGSHSAPSPCSLPTPQWYCSRVCGARYGTRRGGPACTQFHPGSALTNRRALGTHRVPLGVCWHLQGGTPPKAGNGSCHVHCSCCSTGTRKWKGVSLLLLRVQ